MAADFFTLEQQPRHPDHDADEWPVVQLLTDASQARPLEGFGPCWVFDLGCVPVKPRGKPKDTGTRPPHRIERTAGVTRCTRVAVQDTAEWKDREAARRARQTPPKPGAKVKAAMNAMKARGSAKVSPRVATTRRDAQRSVTKNSEP